MQLEEALQPGQIHLKNESDGPVARVCHPPAILCEVKLTDGRYLVDLTGFKDDEDSEIELLDHLLFSLEVGLKRRGAVLPWSVRCRVNSSHEGMASGRSCRIWPGITSSPADAPSQLAVAD